MADTEDLGAKKVQDQTNAPATLIEASAPRQEQTRGVIAEIAATPAPSNTLAVVEPRYEAPLTPLQQRIADGEPILLENSEHAQTVTDGTVIVYVGQDSGMTIGSDGTLQRFVPYVAGDDIPVELARRLVANRSCALQGSALDPYAQPAA